MIHGKEYDEVRCLFCYTGCEKEIADRIDAIEGVKAIIPMRVKRYKVKGNWEEEQKLLFPGYVFAYSVGEINSANLENIFNVVRIIKNDEKGSGALQGSDAAFAKTLWVLNGKIGVMKAVCLGERVCITDGVFKTLNGRVVAMDRRKMAAKVELSVVGSILSVWLSYEIIDVVNESNQLEILPADNSALSVQNA